MVNRKHRRNLLHRILRKTKLLMVNAYISNKTNKLAFADKKKTTEPQ